MVGMHLLQWMHSAAVFVARARAPDSAEAAGNVGLGPLVGRAGEDLLGRPELDEPADEGAVALGLGCQKRGEVADAAGLLEVVRDDHDRYLRRELAHQVLDTRGADR